jgi:glucosamine-6-phosphate deaminase
MKRSINKFYKDKLQVNIYEDKSQMGSAAANFVAENLRKAIKNNGSATLILATGASQFSFLESFTQEDLDWKKISVFHLDEYVGISDEHPASFRNFLKERIINTVKPGQTYFLNGDANNLKEEIEKYETLLQKHPIDVACIGIGENGHIAFNDPPVADFNDSRLVKVVKLDEASRKQQVGEGWFSSLKEVPKEAITLTIPAIMNCRTISCVVPEKRKAQAVYNTLNKKISTSCPSTILRNHSDTVLFLDKDSASSI